MALGGLKGIGKKVGGAAMGAGRGMGRMGDNKLLPAALIGIAGAGLIGKSAGSVVDLGNEAAFSDENADQAFLGSRGLSPGTVFDSTLGTGSAAAGTVAGGAIGAAAGGAAGMGMSSVLTESLKNTNIPEKFGKDIPLIGGKKIPSSLLKSGTHSPKIRGLGAVGAIAGAAIGGAAYMKSYVNRNREFFESNPYNRGSAAQASSTSAYGDIVLGMHNSRRG